MHKNLLQLLLILSLVLGSITTFNSSIKSQAFVNNFQKAINIRSRYNTDFASFEFKQVVDRMKNDGAGTITFVIQHNVQNLNSNDVFPVAITPTDDALINGINYVKSKGMKAAFNMFIDCNCGAWRAEINPTDRNQFFNSYSTVVQKYAKIAQANGIDFINLGTEMASLSNPGVNIQNTQKWRDLIRNTRSNYSGKLTYGGNWGAPYEEMSKIEFWNDLDFIGISAYFDLSKDETPSVDTLKTAWANIESTTLQPLVNRWNKPIVFTEMGYRSVNQAGNSPGDWSRPAYFMEDGQANAFDALFSFFNTKTYLAGVNVWDISSDPNYGGQGNVDYTFVNKKAENIIKKWFLDLALIPPTVLTGILGSQGKMSSEIKSPITNLKLNQSNTLKYNIQNRNVSVNNSNVLFEIVDGTGAIVFNEALLGQSINNSETKAFEKTWTPTKSGNYKLRGGVFTSDWKTCYEWFDNISSLDVATPIVSSSSPISSSSSFIKSSSITSSIVSSSSTSASTNSNSVSKSSPLVSSSSIVSNSSSTPTINSNLNIWWPANDLNMIGNAPFKAVLEGKSINDYKMYWQVDNGNLVEMYNDNQNGGYKFFWVNFADWTWKPKTEKYKITFTAKNNNGGIIATNSVNIFANK
jgi:hypothetical protein